MTQQLRRAYRRLGTTIPRYGDVEEVIAIARRRRRMTVVWAAVAAAMVTGIGLLTPQILSNSDQPAPSVEATPSSEHSTIDFEDWVPSSATFGAPAPAGTMIYHTCIDKCGVRLIRPDGEVFLLSELRPDLAGQLDRVGLEDVSLSYDALWLGIPDEDGGYTLYYLPDENRTLHVSAGPPGSRWELVGGILAASTVLAQWSQGRIIAYALVDTVRDSVNRYQLPEPFTDLLPVGNGGDSVRLARIVHGWSFDVGRGNTEVPVL